MSKIWSGIIILSIVIAFLTNNLQVVLTSITESSKEAMTNLINLTGMMCFWCGIFKIFENTTVLEKFSKKINKVIGIFFNKKEVNDEARKYIALNVTSNLIGIGNASTINAIKAMEEMDKINTSKKPNNSMTKFVLLNTASIQILPTSMIAIRTLFNSSNPSEILIPVWIVTAISLIVGMSSIIILNKKI